MPAADLPIVARALSHQGRTAVVAAEGRFTYRDLIEASERVAACLLNGRADLVEARVAFLVPAGWHYVATQWGIWRAGGVAVPLATSHPPAELEHVIQDAEPEIVVAHPDFADTIRALGAVKGLRVIRTDEVPLPLTVQPAQLALINVVATLLAETPMVPAPAWAVKLKPTGLPAFTTNEEGVMPVTIEASACGGAFTARNRPIAAIRATGSNFNTRLFLIG